MQQRKFSGKTMHIFLNFLQDALTTDDVFKPKPNVVFLCGWSVSSSMSLSLAKVGELLTLLKLAVDAASWSGDRGSDYKKIQTMT